MSWPQKIRRSSTVWPNICDDKQGFAKYLWKKLPEICDDKRHLTFNTAELLPNIRDNHQFAYVDKYTVQLGLSKKDRYTISELEEAFVNYYPRWLFAAKKPLEAQRNSNAPSTTLGADGSTIMLHDPDCIIFLDQTTRQEIQRQVVSQIAAKTAIPVLAITSSKLSPVIFARMLDFVKQKGMKQVVRLYKPKTFLFFMAQHLLLYGTHTHRLLDSII